MENSLHSDLGKRSLNPQAIIARLGVDAVLLPIKAGTKKPTRVGWQNTAFQSTQHPTFQKALAKASTIGVLLGDASQGLCTIDFDRDDAGEEFLAANPILHASLRTKGKRGFNVWVIIDGTIPPSRKLTSGGKPIGEWRAKAHHTIIAGRHCDGGEYTRIVDAAPLRVKYSALIWPFDEPGTSLPHHHHPPLSAFSTFTTSSVSSESSVASVTSESSVQSVTLNPLHPLNPLHLLHPQPLGERIKNEEQARAAIDSNPSIKRLYERMVEKHFSPAQGRRNSDVIKLVTFLVRAVGRKQQEMLVGAFYDLNQAIFLDPREQHMAEAKAHADTCMKGWLDELPAEQRNVISTLPESHVEAFRICRDLAMSKNESCQAMEFFLSCNELADRIGIAPMPAQRILRMFESEEWLETVKKGTRRVKGERGKATSYRWLLPAVAAMLILLFSFHQLICHSVWAFGFPYT